MGDRGADARSDATPDSQRQQQMDLFARFPHVREFFCGGTAAAINIVVTFPPNKVMFRQQVHRTICLKHYLLISLFPIVFFCFKTYAKKDRYLFDGFTP